MKRAPTSELALKLIEENKKTKSPHLDLGRCSLTHFPPELENSIWIRSLILSNKWKEYSFRRNTVEVVRSKNSGLHNRISTIEGIRHLANLTKLVVSGDSEIWPLDDLSEVSKLLQLQWLDCSKTSIGDLASLQSLEQLEILFCSSTLVENITPLSNLKRLGYFFCSTTNVSSLSSLSNAQKLVKLDVQNTIISSLEPLAGLRRLKDVSFSFTPVEHLEPLSRIPNLDRYNAIGCVIRDCPPDVYETNDGDILRTYFQRRIEDEKSLEEVVGQKAEQDDRPYDVKLILLGNSNSGKTTLLNYLKTGKFEEGRKSTHGLEVSRWLPDSERFPSLGNVAVSVWDFGGQEYYHGAYRLFMSPNAAYILLWDKDTDLNGRRPEFLITNGHKVDLEHFKTNYWLDTVRSYGGDSSNSPLLVIQNKTDLNGKFRLSQDLHSEYGISESFHLSLKCGCNPEEYPREHQLLRHFDIELEHLLKRMVDEEGVLPESWLQVRASLLELQKGVVEGNPFAKFIKEDGSLTLSDFESACRELLGERFKDGEERSIAITLNQGGVLTYLDVSKKLSSMVLTKPEDLAEGITKLVENSILNVEWLKVRSSVLELQDEKADREKNAFAAKLKEDSSLNRTDFIGVSGLIMGKDVSEEEVEIVDSLLFQKKELLFLGESGMLIDRVFVKPADLADKIYEILNDQVLESKGEFTLKEIFGKNPKSDFQAVFIRTTQELGLIFRHPTKKDAFIAPQYLPEKHPIEDLYKIASHGKWQSAFWVKVPLFYYKKLLYDLLMHFAGDGTEARYFWKHGIFFLRNGLRVIIKGLYPSEVENEGLLHVGVEQNQKDKSHLVLLRKVFNEILRMLVGKGNPNSVVNIKQQANKEKYADFEGVTANDVEKIKIKNKLGKVIPNWLEASVDGEYFVNYANLRKMAVAEEIRIEVKNKKGEYRMELIRHFEALLDQPPKRAKRVFVSYSHSNTKWLGRLRNHLSGLRRSNDIETWDDQEILPGDLWDNSIKDKLAEADVFILLLSADFIASNYIWDVELKTAIEKFREVDKKVIPILIEPLDLGGLPMVDEEGTKIQDFEIVPKNNDERLQAVSLWQNHDEALAKVAERIRQTVRGK